MTTGTEGRWDNSMMKIASLTLGGTAVSSTAAEINKLAGVTGGTVTASKALVVGASKDLDALNVAAFTLDTGTKTATATAGAATLNKKSGKITTAALTTAAGATYTLTLTNSAIAAADIVLASVALGTATTGVPVITTIAPAAGSVVIVIQNIHASAALDGTIVVSFATLTA